MIDEALAEIGKTSAEFYGYIDSWIEGDTVVVRVLKQHENEHFYSDPLFIKADHFRFYGEEEFLIFKIMY